MPNLLLILERLLQFLQSEKLAFQFVPYAPAHFSAFQEQLFLTHDSGQNTLGILSLFGKIPYPQRHQAW